jgi:8-oxo-dGTP diphosphatase
VSPNAAAAPTTRPRFTVEPRTLVFLLAGDAVLLIERAPTARLFAGYFNGIGGHVERGEDILTAAVREVREETGLVAPALELRGILTVGHSQYDDAIQPEAEPGALVFIFVGYVSSRAVTPSDEGRLHWVPLDRLDTVRLMPDLLDLLPRLLGRSQADGPLFLARR